MLSVYDLNRQQLIELKEEYINLLCDTGNKNEVLYDKREWDKDDLHPLTQEEIDNVDNLIPDSLIFDYYQTDMFESEDFITKE